jgi:dephospho-CoA kinase
MKHCGITGGIASGKSMVCQILISMGYPVYFADSRAQILTNTNTEIQKQLINRFGDDIYVNAKLNKTLMRNLIFKSDEARKYVNSVVHPVVRNDYLIWRNESDKDGITFMESALIYNTDIFQFFDFICAVKASDTVRINRLMQRDNINSQDAAERLNIQLSPDEYYNRADFVINNNGTELLILQVLNLIKTIESYG